MRLLDLFTGTGSVRVVAEALGYEVTSLNIDPRCNPDFVADITLFDYTVWSPGSDSDSDDNNNVIYIRRKSKKPVAPQPSPAHEPEPVKATPAASVPPHICEINPFFNYYYGTHRNFQ